MKTALAAALWAACLAAAGSKPQLSAQDSFLSQVRSLVAQQHDQPADVVRALDRKLDGLSVEATRLGYEAAEPFFKIAADPNQPAKLRLWMVAYLQALHDPAAFLPLTRLLLDKDQPDLVRDAAARALGACPVAAQAKRRALCAALDAGLESAALAEVLIELRQLGCDDAASLKRVVKLFGKRPEGRQAAVAAHGIAALGGSRGPAALAALDALFDYYPKASPLRAVIIRALESRLADLRLERKRWVHRFIEMLKVEARQPESAQCAIRILAGLGDRRASGLLLKFIRHEDGLVAVVAAEALAALDARQAAGALADLYDAFPLDPRFAPLPDRDVIELYERLGAALQRLQ